MKCVDLFLKNFLTENVVRRISSKGIIISDTNKILLLRIQTGCHAEGVWDLPGGGIENGETPLDALKREIKEETNLDLDPKSIKKLDSDSNFDIPEDGIHAKWKYFKAKCTNTNVILNPAKWNNNQPEHSEYKWIDKNENLDNYDLCDQHKKIIHRVFSKM